MLSDLHGSSNKAQYHLCLPALSTVTPRASCLPKSRPLKAQMFPYRLDNGLSAPLVSGPSRASQPFRRQCPVPAPLPVLHGAGAPVHNVSRTILHQRHNPKEQYQRGYMDSPPGPAIVSGRKRTRPELPEKCNPINEKGTQISRLKLVCLDGGRLA